MQDNRWKEIENIFNRAAEMPIETRRDFVRQECGSDEELRGEVLRLLESDAEVDSFLARPLFTLGARVMDQDVGALVEDGSFGTYRIIRTLGRGGMGRVFLAEDSRLSRLVALKVLPSALTDDDEAVRRFQQEARAASNVTHPSVAHMYEIGEFEGHHYLAMEYVRGRTLRELIREKLIDREHAIDIGLQAATGLSAEHNNGVIHRDIKPENLIVGEDGTVKILDFGLAKLNPTVEQFEHLSSVASLDTVPGLLMGTVAYMSPEQLRGHRVDERADVWSLGICLYEMVLGRRPFSGETPSDVSAAILRDPIKLPSAEQSSKDPLHAIIRKCLAKNRLERYEAASDLAIDLQRLQTDSIASGKPREVTSYRKVRRLALSKILSVFVVAGAGFLAVNSIPSIDGYLFDSTVEVGKGPANDEGGTVPLSPPATRTANPEAEREYQAGRHIWNKRKVKDMPKALAHFQKAVELDPSFAAAFAGLADAYMWDGNPSLNEEEKRAHRRAALQRAIALDPNLAEAHASYASLLGSEWNWTEAIGEFEKAIQLNPEYATAHQWYAETLVFLGRDEKAIEHINRAVELDPLSFAILNDAMTIHWYAGRYEEAIAKAHKMIAFDPRHEVQARLWMSRLYAHLAEIEQARREFRRYEKLEGKVSDENYANFYALIGEKGKALLYIKKVESAYKGGPDTKWLAGSYALLDMNEEAFKWLEIDFENRNPSIVSLAASPDFDGLRSDPRYRSLLERMNLLEFWKDRLSAN